MPDNPTSPVEETLEEATAKGYIGTTPDKTPNEEYTVAGSVARSQAAGQEIKADAVIGREDVTPAAPRDRARRG